MHKPRILIHSLIFSPDGVSTAYLYNDIALALYNAGYDVKVITTTPHFNIVENALLRQPLKWRIWGILKSSEYHGIKVLHIPQKKFKSSLLRIIGFAYWHIVSFIVALLQRHVDIIISPSPPLTLGLVNIWLKKLKGCKVIYNVQEIYPDILNLRDGIVKSNLSRIERIVYNGSDAVTTIDRVFHDTIQPRFNDPSKLSIIPNFVDTELYHPLDAPDSDLPNRYFPKTDSLKLLYAGNIGYAQDWEPLIELAKSTREENIDYFVIGEGVMKEYLLDVQRQHDLRRLHILPYQPRELMPQIIAYSDVQFIFMHPTMDKQGFPSKIYTIMACGKPMLIISQNGSPIDNFLRPLGCAKVISASALDDKVAQAREWLNTVDTTTLRQMGNAGHDVIHQHYRKDIVTEQYVNLVSSLLI